jgi:hypothetical protein
MQQRPEISRMKNLHFTSGKCAILAAVMASTMSVNGGFAANPALPQAVPADAWRYADMADLFAGAPLVIHAKIAAATAIKMPPQPDGAVRFYVEGDVVALIRGTQAVPPKLVWLVDIRPDSRGKIPKLKKAQVLLAALPVQGRPGEIRLAARDAQVFWSPNVESRTRAVVAAAAAPDAPPPVTGISSAFHTAGTITGEGETQIFLSTANNTPVSISVLTRPGQAKRWAVALGEIVDESAGPPAVDTLTWYRLACFLPGTLPTNAVAELPPSDADAARSDYAFVMQALGACPRVRR